MTGLVAPLVVSAKGMVGDAEVTLVSAVVGTLPASGSVAITVSPLTNAVAAMLAPSGDPAALAPANVTALALAATGFGFRGVGLFLSDAQFVRRESSVQCAVGRSAVRG